jgi:hypothetical protein
MVECDLRIEFVFTSGSITTLDGTTIALTRCDNDIDMLANKNRGGQVVHVPRWAASLRELTPRPVPS